MRWGMGEPKATTGVPLNRCFGMHNAGALLPYWSAEVITADVRGGSRIFGTSDFCLHPSLVCIRTLFASAPCWRPT